MKLNTWALCAALLAVSAQAHAGGSVRAAVGSGGFELDEDDGFDAEADLSSVDLRARWDVTGNVFLRGQYTNYSADEVEVDGDEFDADLDITPLRLAVGYGAEVGPLRLYGAAEYLDLELELEGESESESGWGITAGIGDQGKSKLMWSAELSLLKVDETSGASLDASIGYRITDLFAVLGGVQSYAFNEDDDETSFGSAYLGLQLSF